MSDLAVCFRGNANTWECDEMGHMNVRFYISKAREGLDVFGSFIGLTPTWLFRNGAEFFCVDQHVRYIKEFHGGHDLYITAGLLDVSENSFRLYQEVRHANGEIGASVISLVELRDLETDERLLLPDFAQEGLTKHTTVMAAGTGPRTIKIDGFIPGGTMARAEEIGMTPVSLGSVRQAMVDSRGRLVAEGCISRVSDGIGHFMRNLRAPLAGDAQTETVRQVGGAAVEYRLRYHTRPKLGDTVAVYAGLIAVERTILDVSHWTVDVETGAPVCSSRAIALSLDLTSRKAIAIPDELRPTYEARLIDALQHEHVPD